ncbi:hypothetical protein MJG53_009159 [Ovis ammon polii x Ovis aries]|uniref:Uncharacterized protein n=1 Tax=Ovis ammon polii x Ovis aries TaxID=2918886 RepID=A0ACB9UYU4_9CETA|nr:hypothetical protein MJG53_009159 [Ovis ammon polii x Ovis aries]
MLCITFPIPVGIRYKNQTVNQNNHEDPPLKHLHRTASSEGSAESSQWTQNTSPSRPSPARPSRGDRSNSFVVCLHSMKLQPIQKGASFAAPVMAKFERQYITKTLFLHLLVFDCCKYAKVVLPSSPKMEKNSLGWMLKSRSMLLGAGETQGRDSCLQLLLAYPRSTASQQRLGRIR